MSFHRLISTDAGSQCLSCGAAFDGEGTDLDEIEALAPCPGVHDGEAHHFTAEYGADRALAAVCAYCSTAVTEDTLPADVPADCPRVYTLQA